MDKKRDAPKEKRRNNEKRKEKSRDAARSRRSKETEIFFDLGNNLPILSEQVSQLDKASIMRLAISYLKVRDMVHLVPELKTNNKEEKPTGSLEYLKSLDGFILVLSSDGDFVYLSDNVSDYLGISQIDLMGQNVFEYCHPCDHDEVRETLSGKTQSDCSTKSLFLRLKCTLTSKGRSVNLKSATYKIIHCTGHLVKKQKETQTENGNATVLDSCFIALGKPIPHPSNIETPLPKQTFLTKHSMDMKFTHADDEFMTKLLGYEPDDLLGKSVYKYHHAMDMDLILSAFKCLFSKGQCETNRYRFLAKSGGYVWVVTQATLIQDKTQKPQSVVCVNYVLSGLECKGEIYSASQFAAVQAELAINNNNNNICVKISSPPAQTVPDIVVTVVDDDTSKNIINNNTNNNDEEESAVKEERTLSVRKPVSSTAKLFGFVQKDPAERPQSNTSKIFVPRTRDMNKGFLMFSDEAPGQTMLKDEPDDLTHLAPVAGDVCVPLEENPLLNDMFDDILLPENFAPLLLADEPPADPFISYRDFQDPSPQLLSPNLSKHSDCSLPSLNSPSDSLVDDDQISTFMNLQMEDDPDLLLKAPYIPMNVTDDLPLLMSNDLMWSSNEKKHQQLPENNSSLAQLLSTSMNKHNLKSNDHGGGLLQEQNTLDYMYNNEKNLHKSWTSNNNNNNTSKTAQVNNKIERTPSIKRPNSSINDTNTSKRTKSEPKEKMSSELLQQLMSNNHNRGRPKGKSNWLLEGNNQKAACISQPSDSVLMNLLDDSMESDLQVNPRLNFVTEGRKKVQLAQEKRRQQIRKNSISLLDPDATSLASFMDLTQQDYEVNAPVSSSLLQGQELLMALEINTAI